MSRIFVVGDIHGADRALEQCLVRSSFNAEEDVLICLGDVCDGWPETRQAIDRLLSLKHLIYIMGNHDVWALEWMQRGLAPEIWLKQGGKATVESYKKEVPVSHIDFLQEAKLFHEMEDRLFVHAGFDPKIPIETQSEEILLWDRTLALIALDFYDRSIELPLASYDEVYLGHTPIPSEKPIRTNGIWLMDTGAGWSGVLSMMNVETKEIFCSDPVPGLYPGIPPRKKKS